MSKVIQPRYFIPLLFLLISSPKVFSSDDRIYSDTIITSGRDSLACKITLVNELNIFYDYPHKKSERSDLISLKEVHSYIWNNKTIDYAKDQWKRRTQQEDQVSLGTHESIHFNFKDGGYRSARTLQNQTPDYACKFSILEWDNNDDLHLYKIKSRDGCMSNKEINKWCWGIYQDGQFYLNALGLNMRKGFIKISNLRKYTYFKGIPMLSVREEERLRDSSINFGLIGASITSQKIKKENFGEIRYVLNIETGISRLMTARYMELILSPHPDLLTKYRAEANHTLFEKMYEYLYLLNEREDNK